jgi:hypothetical protein
MEVPVLQQEGEPPTVPRPANSCLSHAVLYGGRKKVQLTPTAGEVSDCIQYEADPQLAFEWCFAS